MMQVLHGILLLARFRAEGFAQFTATPLGFMNSMAPMLGITVVAALRPLLAGNMRALALHLLTSVIALLGPPVLSHLLARAWKREEAWLRYVVAFNWCQAVVTLVTVVLILMLAVGGGVTRTGDGAGIIAAVAGVLIYWIGLCWFMAWRGLGLGKLRSVLAVIVINVGTGVLVMGPQLLIAGLSGPAGRAALP
jgi:hypothetical protein